MSNDEYRAEQSERRQHGLKARHELRLENATYTAADVKVLTDAAFKLGRKEAADEHNHAPVCCCVFQPENPCPICPKHGETARDIKKPEGFHEHW